MEFSELVKGRQSDRKYLPKEVEKEKIIKCLLEAKVRKPLEEMSGWNRY